MKEEGVPINLIASVTVPGTYKLDGKDLNNQFNNGKAKVDVDDEIKGMDAKTKSLLSKQLVVKNSDNQEIPFYAE